MPPSLPRTLFFFNPILSISPKCKHSFQLRLSSTSSKVLVGRPIPPPTPWVPSVEVFLSLIGRQMSQFSTKIPSWEALFQLTSTQLQGLGIEPTAKRRYLLWWRERFRSGIWGVGGEFKFVSPDGLAFVRTIQVTDSSLAEKPQELTPLRESGKRKIIVNVPPPNDNCEVPPDALPASGALLTELDVIGGKWFEPIKAGNGQWSRILRKEGMWEQRQGKKKFGGERREGETKHKMRIAAAKKAREAKEAAA